jgi:hypothetical protein
MARFCTSCGSSLPEATKFCPACGAPASSTPVQAQAASPASGAGVPSAPPRSTPAVASAAPAAPSKTGSPVVKIILALLVFFVVIGLLLVGGMIYVGYRVHKRVEALKKEFPVTDRARSSGWAAGSGAARNPNWDRDVCSLVTKEEVTEAIGSPIAESMNDSGAKSKCVYKGPQGSSTQVGLEVDWDGGGGEILAAQIASKAIAGNQQFLSKVAGVGDDAVADPFGAMLIVRKGEASITVDMRGAPNKLEAAKIIANKAIARM